MNLSESHSSSIAFVCLYMFVTDYRNQWYDYINFVKHQN